jgi:hypothetical protein
MGFEIIYHYKQSAETPGEYQDEILTKTTKIGKYNEDVSLEVLAGKIMSQLARRNILIVDIEIFEYTKKKISYKENENGILIKNKKFSFDSGSIVSSDSEEDEDVSKILEDEVLLDKIKKIIKPEVEQDVEPTPKVNLCQVKKENKKAIRQEIYDPELMTKAKVEQKGYKFTVGKKYSIFLEKSLGAGILNYLTKDDTGREVEVSSECFIVPPAGLSFGEDEPQYHGATSCEIDLWKNMKTEESMPDIRRR